MLNCFFMGSGASCGEYIWYSCPCMQYARPNGGLLRFSSCFVSCIDQHAPVVVTIGVCNRKRSALPTYFMLVSNTSVPFILGSVLFQC